MLKDTPEIYRTEEVTYFYDKEGNRFHPTDLQIFYHQRAKCGEFYIIRRCEELNVTSLEEAILVYDDIYSK